MSGAARTSAVVAICLLLLGIGISALRAPEPGGVAAAWPSPAELDSLERYLTPVAPAPRVDDYAAFLPAAAAPRIPVREESVGVEAPRMAWRLSAILITGERPLAIINDQQVRPGEPLPGGARVLSIGRDHVVIRESDGTQRTVRISEGTEGPQ